ncbi:hypothetical protein SXCC_00452 [Gluconacetobacter sp. SXCC-1]|nr:hypothetical protein SXCC_00452 [Gluconacetobacter sp. SXCC-1]
METVFVSDMLFATPVKKHFIRVDGMTFPSGGKRLKKFFDFF